MTPSGTRWIESPLYYALVLLMAAGTYGSSGVTNVSFALAALVALGSFVRGRLGLGPLDGPLIAYGGVHLLSGLCGFNPTYSLLYTTELKRLFCPYLVAAALSTRRRLHGFIATVTVAGTLVSIFAIQHSFVEGHPQFKVWSSTTTDMAVLLLISLGPVVAIALFGGPSVPRRIVSAALSLLMILGIVQTSNRSVMIGVLSIALIIALLADLRRSLAFAVVILVTLSLLPAAYTQKFRRGLDWSSVSTQYRARLYPIALEITRDHLPFGIGRRNFIMVHEYYKEPGDEIKPNSHSTILNILVEYGPAGLFVYFWILFTVVRRLLGRVVPRRGHWDVDDAIAIGILASVVGFQVAGLFIFNWGYSLPVTLMWSMIGAAFSPPLAPETAPASPVGE